MVYSIADYRDPDCPIVSYTSAKVGKKPISRKYTVLKEIENNRKAFIRKRKKRARKAGTEKSFKETKKKTKEIKERNRKKEIDIKQNF